MRPRFMIEQTPLTGRFALARLEIVGCDAVACRANSSTTIFANTVSTKPSCERHASVPK